MSLWHRHRWRETGRAFAEAAQRTTEGLYPEQAREILFGITSIELRCEGCGGITERCLIGNHTDSATNQEQQP